MEIPTNGDPYCPVTGEQKDGVLDTTNITGSTLIIHRGTLLPDVLKEKVLSSTRDDEWDKFSAQLNYYLGLPGYENFTEEKMINIVWEELRSRATEMTLMGKSSSLFP